MGMWGALGKFVAAAAMGDGEGMVKALSEDEPAEKRKAEGENVGKGCGKRDGDGECCGHTPEGACIMVSKGGA